MKRKALTYLLFVAFFVGNSQSISLKKLGAFSWVKNQKNATPIRLTPTCEVNDLTTKTVKKSNYQMPQREISFSSHVFRSGATKFKTYKITFNRFALKQVKEISAAKFLSRDNADANITYTDKAHGFIANCASDITEDKRHNMWIITEIGIVKFDGLRYYLYNNESNLPNSAAVSIMCDNENRVWVNTAEGFYYLKNDSCFIPKSEGIDFNLFHGRNISKDNKNTIWITSSNMGVFCVDNKNTLSVLDTTSGLPNNDVMDINFYSDKLYLALGSNGIMIIEKNKWIQLQINEKENEALRNGIISILPVQDTIYAGTWTKGFIRMTKNDTTAYSPKGKFHERIFRVIKTKNGIAYSIYGYGAVIQNGNSCYHYSAGNGLVGNSALGIIYDSFENIWICDLIKGISRINENVFFKNQNPFLPKTIANIRYSPDKKHKWLFLNGDTLKEETDSTYILYKCKSKSGLTDLNFVFDGYITEKNEVWGATYANSGICKISGNKVYFYFVSPVDQERIFSSVLKSSDEKIWFSNEKIGLIYYDIKTDLFYQKNKSNGTLSNSCAGLRRLNEKDLICLFDLGMQKIVGNELFDFRVNGEIFSNKINGIIYLPSGEILIPTETKGLLLLKNQEVFVLDESCGLLSNNVKNIFYNKNHIWLFTDKGIERILYKNNALVFDRVFDNNYGMFISEMFGYIQKTKNGFPSINNKYTYDFHPENERSLLNKPLLQFDSITLNGTVVTSTQKIQFSSSEKLRIKYNFIDWGHENEYTHFVTLISNKKDTSLIQIAKLGEINLTDISPGEYSLYLTVKKHRTNFNSTPLLFIVNPYWYNAWWARVLAFILLSILFLFLYKRKQLQNKKLEAMVEKQTEFLQKEKNELIEKNKIILVQNKEKDALIQEVHHRVKNNLQLIAAMMKMQLNTIDDESKKQDLKEAARRINAMSLVHGMLYNKDSSEYIVLKEYLIELIEKLKELIIDNKKPITFEVDLNSDIKFNITNSVAIGMITSEIVSNAIKYAFANEPSPKILIQLRCAAANKVVLYTIKDNGAGLNEKTKKEGLGMRLIDIFARQIESEYEIQNNNGLEFSFVIPTNEK